MSAWYVVRWTLAGFEELLDADGKPVVIEAPDLPTARCYAIRRQLPGDCRVVSAAAFELDRAAHAHERANGWWGERGLAPGPHDPARSTRNRTARGPRPPARTRRLP